MAAEIVGGGPREGGVDRIEIRPFQIIQGEIDAIENNAAPSIADRERRVELVDERSRLALRGQRLGLFDISEDQLNKKDTPEVVALTDLPDQAMAISEKMDRADQLDRASSLTLNAADREIFAGMAGWRYKHGLERLLKESINRARPSRIPEEELERYTDEPWKWQAPIPERAAAAPEPAPVDEEAERLRATQARVLEAQERAAQAQLEAAETAQRLAEEQARRDADRDARDRADAARPAGPAPALPPNMEDLLKRIAQGVETGAGRLSAEEREMVIRDPLAWMRKRIEQIEKINDTNNPQLGRLVQEITTALPVIREVSPEVEEEFLARFNLHRFDLGVEGSGSVGDILGNFGNVLDKRKLQTLFRLTPGGSNYAAVAQGFRELEKLGNQIAATTKASEKNQLLDQVTINIARLGGDPRAADPAQRAAVLKEWEWAKNVSYKLWVVTARSSYFDAYNTDPDKQMRGSGVYIIKRLLNPRKWVVGRGGSRFWQHGEGNQYITSLQGDFWTDLSGEIARDLQRNNQGGRFVKDADGNITTLEHVRFENVDFADNIGTDTPFVDFYDALTKMDKVRPLFVDPGGFIELPNPNTAEKIWLGLTHLKAEKKQRWFAGIMKGLIDFHRRRSGIGPKAHSHSREELNWSPWGSTDINAEINRALGRNRLTSEDAERLKREYHATDEEVHAKEIVKAAATAGLGSIAGSIFGAIVGGGRRR